MPIVYAPPSVMPSSRVASSESSGNSGMSQMYAAELAAKQRNMEVSAELMQRGMQFQQGQDQQQNQFNQSRQYSARDSGLAQAALAEQAQRYQLQGELNATELSQAENFRLQRLKQNEGGVRAQFEAKQITAAEASLMLTRLRTSIDPLEQRKGLSQQKAMEQQNKIQDYMFHQQVERDDARIKIRGQRFQDRWSVFVDPQTELELGAELSQTKPGFAQMPPEAQKSEIHREAVKRGFYQMGFQKDDGQWEIHPAKGAAGQRESVKPGEEAHPDYNATRAEYVKAAQQAEKNARHDLTLTNNDFEKSRVHPVPLDKQDEWISGRIDQEVARVFGRRAGSKGSQQQQGPPTGKPFKVGSLEDANADQKRLTAEMEKDKAAFERADNFAPDEKIAARTMLGEMQKLFAKWGDPRELKRKAEAGDMDARDDWQRWRAADSAIEELKKRVKPEPPQQLPVNSPQQILDSINKVRAGIPGTQSTPTDLKQRLIEAQPASIEELMRLLK